MILVTGGTGFLGQNFLEQSAEPCAFTGRNLGKGTRIQLETGHKFMQVDLVSDPLPYLKGFKAIVHSSALSSPWGSWREFNENNVLATRRLLEQAAEDGVKQFVHISTPSLYFRFKDARDITENEVGVSPDLSTSPGLFANHYAYSKYLAELEVLKFQDRMHVTILRPRGIFGKHDTTIFPRVIAMGRGSGIPLPLKGEAVLDVTHVDNVTHAIRLALKCEHRNGQAYNITNGEPQNLMETLDKLSYGLGEPLKMRKVNPKLLMLLGRLGELKGLLTGKEPQLTRYTAGILCFDQTLSIKKAQRELGYQPVRSIVDGLKDYAHV